ncbi:MAG TPA: hypothetical protein VNK43_11665 [Gemmatimonadales bacterium]|nr:hypothetical protein [Gemmatimonadales bacterium]
MLEELSILVAVAAGLAGFVLARNFVRHRLRFVDAVYRPGAPVIAGMAAGLLALPAAMLPIVTTTAAALFGVGTGLGTASGVKALKRGEPGGR